MIVLDASVIVEILLRTDAGGRALSLVGDDQLHLPALADVEVAQVVRGLTLHGEMSLSRAAEAIGDLQALPAIRHDHRQLLVAIWTMRSELSAYDAVYVALAAGLGATLVTRDGRLAATARRRVEVVLCA